MSKEYLPDTEKRILLSALSHEMKLVKDNNLTELIPVVKNLDYKFMYDRLFKKIEDNAYQQGRADGYSKAENDYHEKHQDILIKQYEGGYEQGIANEKNRIEEELVKYNNDSGMIEIQKVIDIIEEVEE